MIFLVVTSSCRSSYSPLKELKKVNDILDTAPDSALRILSLMDTSSLITNRLKAEYGLTLAAALDKNYIDTTDCRIIIPAISYFKRRKPRDNYQKALYYLGRIQQNGGNLAESSISLKAAEDLIPEVSDTTYMMLIYMASAQNLHDTYAFQEELRYVEMAEDLGNRSPQLARYAARTSYRKAVALAGCNQYEKALSIMDSLRICEQKDTFLIKKCCLDYGFYSAIYGNGYNSKGLDAYKDAIELGAEFSDDDLCAYALLVGLNGNIETANKLFQMEAERGEEASLRAKMWKSELAAEQKNYKEAYTLLDETLAYQDSVVSKTLQQSLYAAQAKEYRTRNQELVQREKNVRLTNLVIGLIVFIIISGLILSLILLVLQSRLREKEQEAEMAKKLTAIREKYFKEQFVPFGMLLEHYERARQRGANKEELLQVITSRFQGIVAGTEGDDWFENALNEEMDGIMAAFRKDFPSLHPLDYRIFCYYAIGFDATLISYITALPSTNAVYHRKNRLKKRIKESNARKKEQYLRIFL